MVHGSVERVPRNRASHGVTARALARAGPRKWITGVVGNSTKPYRDVIRMFEFQAFAYVSNLTLASCRCAVSCIKDVNLFDK